MSIPARHDLFGDPSDSLVPEAVWMFHEEEDEWPTWSEALPAIAELAHCPPDEAEWHLLGAVVDGDVHSFLDDTYEGDAEWRIAVPDAIAERIARRYLDLTMKRRDREETW